MNSVTKWLYNKFMALSTEYKAFSLFIPLIILAIIFGWYSSSPTPLTNEFTEATSIKGTNVPKVDTPVTNGTVKVLPKKVVKKAIPDLPAEIDKPNIEITATADVPPSANGVDVVSTIDTTTGETKIAVKEHKASFFAFKNERRIGAGYGTGTNGPTAKIYADYGFLRVGNVHFSVQGEIRSTTTKAPEANAFIQADYRF